jgi:hypothetical protein
MPAQGLRLLPANPKLIPNPAKHLTHGYNLATSHLPKPLKMLDFALHHYYIMPFMALITGQLCQPWPQILYGLFRSGEAVFRLKSSCRMDQCWQLLSAAKLIYCGRCNQ